MGATGSLAHIDISVGHPERSIPFYDAFLRALGYKRWMLDHPDWNPEKPRRATWSIRQPDGTIFGVECRPARESSRDRRYDRYEPGPHHIAFHAGSKAAVDAVHEAIVAVEGEVLDPPTEYGGQVGYGDAYYAVFFADPDGVKLEVVYNPHEHP